MRAMLRHHALLSSSIAANADRRMPDAPEIYLPQRRVPATPHSLHFPAMRSPARLQRVPRVLSSLFLILLPWVLLTGNASARAVVQPWEPDAWLTADLTGTGDTVFLSGFVKDSPPGDWPVSDGLLVGPNLYAYVRQNPWTGWDPLGLADRDTRPKFVVDNDDGSTGWIAHRPDGGYDYGGSGAPPSRIQSLMNFHTTGNGEFLLDHARTVTNNGSNSGPAAILQFRSDDLEARANLGDQDAAWKLRQIDTAMAAAAMSVGDGLGLRGPTPAVASPGARTAKATVAQTEAQVARVGQWMSKSEYETFTKTGVIPRSNVLTKGKEGYQKQASVGDHYVEFDVNPALLMEKDAAKGWSLIKSKNAMQQKLAEKKGQTLPPPKATNIKHVDTKEER